MRILVPYTARHLDTIAGLPGDAEWRYVGDDNEAYWRLLAEVWDCGDDLLIVEHDIVCRPDVIESFDTCEQPWCAFGYSDICHPACMEAWANALGCTRFRKELMAAVPNVVSSIPEGYGRDWHNLCDHIAGTPWLNPELRPECLRANGFTHHWHTPSVVHHHMRLDHLCDLIGG